MDPHAHRYKVYRLANRLLIITVLILGLAKQSIMFQSQTWIQFLCYQNFLWAFLYYVWGEMRIKKMQPNCHGIDAHILLNK